MRKFLIAIFFFLFTNQLHAQQPVLSEFSDLEGELSLHWMNSSTLIQGFAHSGTTFSRVDSLHCFGIGYENTFSPLVSRKNLYIHVNAFFRTSTAEQSYVMVFMISLKDSVVYWSSSDIQIKKTKDEWTSLDFERTLPSNITLPDYNFKVYIWNPNCRGAIDADDFKIDFFETSFPGFLPEAFDLSVNNKSQWTEVGSSPFVKVMHEEQHGNLCLLNVNGDTLIKKLAIVTQWKKGMESSVQTDYTSSFKLINDSSTKEYRLIRFKSISDVFESEVTLLLSKDVPNLTFEIHTTFLQNIWLDRQALLSSFQIPFAEIIQATGIRQNDYLEKEYWIGKQGFSISSSTANISVYHPKKLSSIELNTVDKYALFNFDFSKDHPLLHFPLLKQSKGKSDDYSCSVYKKGDDLNANFTFYFGKVVTLPVISSFPLGYESAMIWTEHADFADMRTHKAVYFGSESIDNPEKSTGGFLKHGIPVTKSVFYANPEKQLNREKHAGFTGEVSNYLTTPGYSVFLKQLDESGIEICLHTPDPFTTTRIRLDEACGVMKKEFASVTWIDHGYDNEKKSNREDLNCDGLESTSPSYAADLWKKNGIRYVWNSFYEDAQTDPRQSFYSFFPKPYPGFGQQFPRPVYWQHPTRSNDLYHWRTTSTVDPPDGNLWNYLFSEERLNDLCAQRYTEIIHCYPARVDSTNGFYSITDGNIQVNQDFDKTLRRLAGYRDNGRIWLSTIRSYMEYQEALDLLDYTFQKDGSIVLTNNSMMAIHGLTLLIDLEYYSLDSISPMEIKKKDDQMMIGVLKPEGTVRLFPTRK